MDNRSFTRKIKDKIRLLLGQQPLPPEYLSKPPVLFKFDSLDNASNEIQASHAGNIGDVVYSCILLKSFWEKSGKKFKLHLQTNVPFQYSVNHPLQNILMNNKMAENLVPLLQNQAYISEVTIGNDLPKSLHLNLNKFRDLPIDYRCGLILGYQQLCSDFWINIFEPWISSSKLPEYYDKILISRTSRLRSNHINYKFLSECKHRLIFIGLPEEYENFKHENSINCEYVVVDNFKQLADIINSCHLFVGNQGFLYTLAESIQCPRVLESNSIAPNNYPMSSNGRIALFQEQFEAFVNDLSR